MLVFPQLTTGAAALYPVIKQGQQRSVVNTLAGGNTVVYADPDAQIAGWQLRATGLTLAEWNAIESLFQQTSGMAGTFTFLDPVGNLLLESENFGAGAWTKGALVALTAGRGDPLGTTRATGLVNAGGSAAGLAQVLDVPGSFEYCLSVWARSTLGSAVTLVVAGGSIQLFGMQAEAQMGPSDYKITGAVGGVYSNARFASDQITVTAQGTDVYDAVIQIVSTGS